MAGFCPLTFSEVGRANTGMNAHNKLLAALDHTIGYPNKVHSSVKKKFQEYDNKTGEHVIVLEYRIKVSPGVQPVKKRRLLPSMREMLELT
jgi:hypothetical protein